MLDITVNIVGSSPKRFLNDIVTLAPAKSERAVLDRRSAGRVPSAGPRRRRRHDGLYTEHRYPLEW
jgi:hypothetical protein